MKVTKGIFQDFRYSFRLLRLSPGFTLLAIVSLALGTGANTALFQLLDSIRVRTLPVSAPQQLVELRIDDMTHARGNWLPAILSVSWAFNRYLGGSLQHTMISVVAGLLPELFSVTAFGGESSAAIRI